MGISSLQVCMDPSDWLQGTIHEDGGMDSSSSPSPIGDMLARPPLMERRLRPQHDQALKCPRCESTHTKFCYYNNYSLSQPRYFCKTCRRYWTKGGTLRNIPVGGGCRKNKKVTSKKTNEHHPSSSLSPSSSGFMQSPGTMDLQLSSGLSFPIEVQLSHLTNLMGSHGILENPSFLEGKYNAMLENPRPIDFMESKYEALVESDVASRSHDFMGNGEHLGLMGGGLGGMNNGLGLGPSFHSLCSPFGMSLDHENNGAGPFMMETTSQRLMLPPFGASEDPNTVDVKPNPKLLALEWQDQDCSDQAGKDSYGYISGMGSWAGLMTGYGSSTTNPLV